MIQVISLELNEVSFDFLRTYIAQGELPTFRRLLGEHQLFETSSEKHYPQLEPWIQWPSVYTGKTLAEHGVFRLGDCVNAESLQIWEALERQNVAVGAVSPMNARNDCRSPAFFLPDPWTDTPVTASPSVERLFRAIRSIVLANAHERFGLGDLWQLAIGAPRHVRSRSLPTYVDLVGKSVRHKWARAIILDRLLADLFINLWSRSRPGYASLFLNAAAHIQHHHLFDSRAYAGEERNPDWYAARKAGDVDPLLSVYRVYDRIIADVQKTTGTRLLITTGLSQKPNPAPFFQYRPVGHAALLARFDVRPARVVPRMSRDFSLFFASSDEADGAADRLEQVGLDGQRFFAVERRGAELFCQIAYRGPPERLRAVSVQGVETDVSEDVVLVSIENAIHQGTGYHLDTAIPVGDAPVRAIRITDIFGKIVEVFGANLQAAA